MVAKGNQWYPRTNSDGPLELVVYQPTIMGITAQNMTLTSNSLLSPTISMVARGNQW